MTKAYDYYSKSNYDFGVLLVKDEAEDGIFHAGLIYVTTSDKEGGVISMKLFYSTKSEYDVVRLAENWIKTNLFSDFEKGPARAHKEISGFK